MVLFVMNVVTNVVLVVNQPLTAELVPILLDQITLFVLVYQDIMIQEIVNVVLVTPINVLNVLLGILVLNV